MDTADAVWGGLLLVGAAFEAYALRNGREGDTFSEKTRWVFRTHTKGGKLVFATIWAGFAAWYMGHVLNWWA